MQPNQLPEHARVIIQLYKGVIYRENATLWALLINKLPAITNHFKDIGIEVWVDEVEGYAFLRELSTWDEEQKEDFPKLIEKRRLTYLDSLLCVILRKKLIENVAQTSDIKLFVYKQEIIDLVSAYIEFSKNDETEVIRKTTIAINHLTDYGFLQKHQTEDDRYEVHRILNAFIDVNFIDDILSKLQSHAAIYFRNND